MTTLRCSSGSSSGVREPRNMKCMCNVASFGNHLFATKFYRAAGGAWLSTPPDPLLAYHLENPPIHFWIFNFVTFDKKEYTCFTIPFHLFFSEHVEKLKFLTSTPRVWIISLIDDRSGVAIGCSSPATANTSHTVDFMHIRGVLLTKGTLRIWSVIRSTRLL